MKEFQQALIKIGALLSYCGGPLVLCGILRPQLGAFMAFAVTIAPILLMVFGTEALLGPNPRHRDPTHDPLTGDEFEPKDGGGWEILLVWLGLAGAVVVLLMHAHGAWILATTPRRADHGLYVLGILVGIPLACAYACLAGRWLGGAGAPKDTFAPIE